MTPSHRYEFRARDCLGLLWPSLVWLAGFAGLMHLGAAAGLWPSPCPALDTDRTILLHQAAASQSPGKADLLLIGDSSCLMDVSVKQLLAQLTPPRTALNLGTLSYLDLRAFAALLKQFASRHPQSVQTIVLLMHPEALRRPHGEESYREMLEHFLAERDYCPPNEPAVLCSLGVERFRGRLLARWLPQPLGGQFGRTYGFTHDLWNHLTAEHGSALDPGTFDPKSARGNAEYRLATSLEAQSAAFRSCVPAGVKLFAAVTPVPEGFAGAAYPNIHRHLLKTWSEWLGATPLLTLPATLPDDLFASTTHLNAEGVRIYTGRLAKALIAAEAGPVHPER